MANQFLDATEYSKAFLLLLKNELVMGRLVTGQFTNEVTDENGLTINIKRPPQFVAQDGAALQKQDIVTGSVPVTVDQYKNVHVGVGDLEYVESFNQLMQNETIKAAASELAHTIDGSLMERLQDFGSHVGTVDNIVGSPQEFNKVHTRLMDQSVPNVDLNAVLSFSDGEEIRGSLIGGDIHGVNRSALERTRIPMLSEINAYASNNLRSVTSGTRSSTAGTVSGANQNVNYRDVKTTNQQTINLAGFAAAATIKKGEIFTIDGVYAVNNRARQTLGYLRQFTVLEDATADGLGDVTLTIWPAIVVGGTNDGSGTITNTAFQTASAVPADAASVTFYDAPSTTDTVRAAFHKRAISLVSARLHEPFTGTYSFQTDKQTGITIRYWRGSDISTGEHIHRWDCIYGTKTIQPMLGARISGQ